jgi:hypothetical protein
MMMTNVIPYVLATRIPTQQLNDVYDKRVGEARDWTNMYLYCV